jgi:5-methylcytosine-specific restriction endonuclease McrA
MVRKPIEKAIDFVVVGAVKGFKKLFGGAIGWVKGKYEKGKKFVKDKATAAKDWAVGKAKGAAGWAKGKLEDVLAKLGFVTVEEDFDMQGEDHEVKAVADPAGKMEVTMASHVAVALRPLVKQAISAVGKSNDKDKADTLDLLDQINADLDLADASWDAISRDVKKHLKLANPTQPDEVIDEMRASYMTDGEKELRLNIKKIVTKIRKLKAPSIKALIDKVGGRKVFPPDFINIEGKFRDHLYDKPAGWSSVRSSFNATARTELRKEVQRIHDVSVKYAASNPKWKAARKEVELMTQRWSGDPSVAKDTVAPGRFDPKAVDEYDAGTLLDHYDNDVKYQVDHIVPLAVHWKKKGYKSDDDERAFHAGDGNFDNLQLLTATQNTSKGSRDDGGTDHRYWEQPFVDDGFDSKDSEVNSIEWITVDKK